MGAKKRKHAAKKKANERGTAAVPKAPRRALSFRKKLAFAIVPFVAAAVLAEIVLFGMGVRPQLDRDDPFVGFSAQVPLWSECELDGQPGLETASNKLSWFNYQRFSRDKPKNVFRIVTLGGSTTYGRPYTDATSFSGWLRELLPAADSTKQWEVINAGGISYASYRVVRVMEETSGFDPDLFVVYTGHNEFLEERTYRQIRHQPMWLRWVTGTLGRTRTYSVMRSLIYPSQTAAVKSESVASESATELSEEVRTRLDKGVGPDAYQRDDALAAGVSDHFRYNLNQMADVAARCGARVIFVTPAANLADCSPFKSQPVFEKADDTVVQGRWQSTLDGARDALRTQDFKRAADLARQAVELQPRDAASQYLLGQALEQLGEIDKARRAFELARDEDVCPLRATTEFVQTLRDVAADRAIPLVDFVAVVEQHSDGQIPGASLFLDHVHPTIDGHRLLAEGLLQEMSTLGMVALQSDWGRAQMDQVAKRIKARIDRKTHADALRNLAKVMTWAGKPDEANRAALEADRLMGDSGDAETLYLAGNAELQRGDPTAAIAKFQQALSIAPDHVQALNSLGAAFYQTKQRANAVKTWQRVVQLDPTFAAVHNNLGSIFQGQRDYDQAAHHFRQAITINPRYASAYNNWGVMLRNQKKYDEALVKFERALAIDSRSAEAHFNVGTIYAERGATQDAIQKMRDSLRLNPKYGPAYHQLAVQLSRTGNDRQALEALKRALENRAPSLEPARLLAWILATSDEATLRNGKQAMQVARQVASRSPQPTIPILRTLAAAHAELGEFDKAIDWIRKAAKLPTQGADRQQLEADLKELNAGRPLRD